MHRRVNFERCRGVCCPAALPANVLRQAMPRLQAGHRSEGK
jgi:hypothetical protein